MAEIAAAIGARVSARAAAGEVLVSQTVKDLVAGSGIGFDDRGLADQISTDETTGAGVAYVRLATDPDPVRVRAAWVTDADIRAMVSEYAPAEKVRPLRADAA